MKPYCLIQSVDAAWIPYLALTYARHAAYAARCGADYLVFTGIKEPGLHPSWNKISLLREALDGGYAKVAWLDADTLVLDPTVNLFTNTSDAPLQMARWGNWIRLGAPHCNAGVIVMTRGAAAMEALTWVWNQRHDPPRPHHIAQHWEQSWLADYVDDHPECFGELSHRFNYVQTWGRVDDPVIQGWHGQPNRLEQLRRAAAALDQPWEAMPDEDFIPGDPWREFLYSKPRGRAYFPALTRVIRDYHITSVVEIGVRAGYGMAAMLRGNPALTYLGIDDGLERPDGLAHAERLRQRYATGDVRFLKTKSQQVSVLPEKFDLAYIDGDHTEAACRHDLELCGLQCTYVLCDDYDFSLGVRQAVQAFCTAYRLPLTYLPTVHGWALMDMRQLGMATDADLDWSRPLQGASMRYYYDGSQPTFHPRLGMIHPGDNTFPDELSAVADACVESGLLRRIDMVPLPEAIRDASPTEAEETDEA